MDNWLKALIAAACLVICAAGANYVWAGWQAKQEADARREAVFQYLDAKPGDAEAARKTCEKVKRNRDNADSLNWNDKTKAYADKMVDICEANGFL